MFELRWDGKKTHEKQLDHKGFYIWSSSTLYPTQIREQRDSWFLEWLAGRSDFSLEAIQQFHRSGGDGDTWNGFIMNRDGRVQTVSITNVVKKTDSIGLIYNDLLRNQLKRDYLNLKRYSET